MCGISRLLMASGGLTLIFPSVMLADSGLEGRYGFGIEAERKKCTSCVTTEHDNEIEVTILDLVLKRNSHPDLSYGLQLEFDTESEGAILGSGRIDVIDNTGLGLWIRKDFDNGFWARAQAAAETDDGLLDLGGRIGYVAEITQEIRLSGYFNLERRFPAGSSSSAQRGTYLEAALEVEWDWGRHGAWAEMVGSRWYFDSAAVADERELVVQPGVWAALGGTSHRGLLWLEFGHEELSGARQKDEFTSELGAGMEFNLPNRSKLMVGVTVGKEREEEPGRPDERAAIYGLEVAFQRRF